jgi:hypothetical protein
MLPTFRHPDNLALRSFAENTAYLCNTSRVQRLPQVVFAKVPASTCLVVQVKTTLVRP